MKKFQLIIQSYIKDHEKQKKQLAVFLALSILVFFSVPLSLIKPAKSMTKNSLSPAIPVTPLAYDDIPKRESIENYIKNNGNVVDGIVYSPREADLITLLFGGGENAEWLGNCTTVDEALDLVAEDYFLGLASDFCAFIEEDFTVYAADAEGRVAVGGDLSFKGNWNYQIGSGDYSRMTALLETDNYMDSGAGVTKGVFQGYAHVLCGGRLYRINTLSTHIDQPSKFWTSSRSRYSYPGYTSPRACSTTSSENFSSRAVSSKLRYAKFLPESI